MKTCGMAGGFRFLPLLAIYVTLAWFLIPRVPIADEERFATMARSMSKGVFSPQGDVDLWFGPGYPLALLPCVALSAPPFAGRLLNAILGCGAAALLYGALREYMSVQAATGLAYAMGLHPLFLEHIPQLMSETLAVFLVCAALCVFIRVSRQKSVCVWQYGLAALALAWLALTKVLYGYVILVGLLGALGVLLVSRSRTAARASVISALALLLCVPYLAYTYGLTGKLFYWSSSGGSSLYWASSPYEGDLGDWHGRADVARIPALAANHEAFFARLDALSALEQDAALRSEAVRNIVNHPSRYARNVVANASRLLFNYPFPRGPQTLSKLLHIVPGAYLLAALTLALGLTARNWPRIPGEIRAVLAFGAIALGGSCLFSAYNRMLLPLLPLALLWVGYTFCRMPISTLWRREEAI